ncbi:hypothetical protein OIO90_001117 [Microbotryomycetes sp. JL221]|nr:hypothetical protein OIO90_001117 [Microbotryomycetes sp. JL221]
MAGQVRLPPVHLPAEDDAPQQGYNQMRRVSLSDPFLHAYPQPPNSSDGLSTAVHSSERNPQQDEQNHMGPPGKGAIARAQDASSGPPRTGSPTDHSAAQYVSSASAHAPNYAYAPPGYPTPHQPYPPGVAQPGPPPNYRFGGPPGPGQNPNGPSYYDPAMRRQSVAGMPPGSSGGLSSHDLHPTPPSTGQKRKSAGEDSIMEETHGAQQPYSAAGPGPSHMAQGPYAKRRGSSLTYDKMGGLSLAEQQARRDSGMSSGALSPWEDDRRGSNGSWTSVGSPTYTMSGYGPPPHPAGEAYDHRGPPPPPGMYATVPPPLPPHHRTTSGSYDGAMGPPGDPMSYGRRPSIGIDQLVEGPAGYGHPPPHMTQPPYPRPDQGRPPSPHQMHPPPPNHLTANYANGPPPSAPWVRGVPPAPAPPAPTVPHRNSSGSLDPMTYGPASMIKDSPYSRSPELRVTHKLAERKRRKEMAQLFEDLKDSLPVERQLKSSKWEILSKGELSLFRRQSVEHIENLKRHNDQLLEENAMLREHMSMGSSSVPHHQQPMHHPGSAASHYEHGGQPPMMASHPGQMDPNYAPSYSHGHPQGPQIHPPTSAPQHALPAQQTYEYEQRMEHRDRAESEVIGDGGSAAESDKDDGAKGEEEQ